MRRITVLEPNIANKIAAGEVVERPASIVKELAENSIDAGSKAITIEIRNGGIDYIRITDNGSGIAEDDVENAFLRHATSKLSSANDLEHIETLGFRGEALASICAVSKLTMRTRTEDGEYGKLIRIDGGVVVSSTPCGCPCGTTIEVTELFFNVPARLKFLKSSRGEAAMIGDYVTRLILSNPSITIRFINNGKVIYQSSGDGKLENALFCVYGNEIASRLYTVNYDDGYLKLTGYVGNEIIAKSTRTQQSLFVNHRYIKSQVISYAVQRAFDTRLMHGKFPFFVINMLISCYEVDVNVHPNKLSVRFKNEDRISFAVTRAVSDALNGKDDYAQSQGAAEAASLSNDIVSSYSQGKESQHISQKSLYRIFGNNATSGINNTQASAVPENQSDVYPNANANVGVQLQAQSDVKPIDIGYMSDNTINKLPLQKLSSSEADRRIEDDQRNSEGANDQDESNQDLFYMSKDENATWLNSTEDTLIRKNDCEADPDKVGIQEKKNETLSEQSGFEYALGNMQPVSFSGDIPVYSLAPNYKAQSIEKPEQTQLSLNPYTVIGAAFDTYIIVQQDDSIYYIDQHAAHERMLYEKLIKNELRFASQLLLVPEYVHLDPIYFEVLSENLERFKELGFDMELISDTTVRINAVPDILSKDSEGFIADAISMIISNVKVSEIDLVRSNLIQASCKQAVKAGDRLESEEIEEILKAYASGEIPLTCPHGRPVIIKVSKTELQKRFKRII